jgi:hypothetical protein
MPAAPLTEEIAFKALGDFFRDKPFVFFGTGMSCAVDSCFGMPALKEALFAGIKDADLPADEQAQWTSVKNAFDKGADLETALNEVTSASLLARITSTSADFIVASDKKYAHLIAEGKASWPAGALLKQLVDRLPNGDPVLHVLTPNYDLLFEYDMDWRGIEFTNGFCGCVQRRLDWSGASLETKTLGNSLLRRRLVHVAKQRKHARLYKVHGSLSYFFHQNAVVENQPWIWDPPPSAKRVMITPGQSKFEVLQKFRKELQGPADAAIDSASRFLFLGYGFNDTHLEEYIRRKLVTQKSMAVVITRDSNPRIDELAANADQMWVITRYSNGGVVGTRIFNKDFAEPLVLVDRELWRIDKFSSQILGV